jgi:peptide/nickel transport system permease protein
VIGFLLSRLWSAVVTVFGVSVLVFSLVHLVPGDPVEVMLGESAQPADRAALRSALGLDRPLPTQFGCFVAGIARLTPDRLRDVGCSEAAGQSLHARRPVVDLIAERLPATLELAAAGLAVALLLAVPLGSVAALRRGSGYDHGAIAFATLGVSVPNFVLGPVLILVFSFALGWLPVSGREGPGALLLPAVTLGTALAAILARMLRSTLLEVLGEDFIRTARAKGLDEMAVLLRHALGNAMLPVVTLLGLQLGALLAGAVITEIVFSWPGLGSLTVEAIQRRDYPLLQGCVLVISVSYVLVNSVTDLVYAWLDPRIRLGEA